MSVARWPILSRCFSTVTPSASVGTTNAVRPRWPASLSVEAKTITHDGLARVGDEHLRAVEDVLVAVAHGRRLDPGDVGAGVRLGQRERAEDRLLEQRRQPLALLLLGAGDQHRQRAEDVGDDRRPDPGAAPAELLADQRALHRAEARRRRAPPGCAGSSARPRAPSRSRRPGASGARRTRPPSAGSPSRRTRARARAAPSARPSARRRYRCRLPLPSPCLPLLID